MFLFGGKATPRYLIFIYINYQKVAMAASPKIGESATNIPSVDGMMNTTAICKLKGSLDVLISPLTIEAIQR